MTRDEVLSRLYESRAAFDERLAAIPEHALDVIPQDRGHSPKQLVAHVSAYEELIVQRLESARAGRTTALDRDRDSWEAFNDRVWRESQHAEPSDVLASSVAVFRRLTAEVARLTDEELNEAVGITAAIDPAWLDGRPLWQLIGLDAFDHYPMHFDALEQAARDAGRERP